MSDSLQLILKKLDEIDARIKKIEERLNVNEKDLQTSIPVVKKEEKDPLFAKALEIAKKYDEVPASLLQKLLHIDQARAEKLIDLLVEAGIGTSYWEEV